MARGGDKSKQEEQKERRRIRNEAWFAAHPGYKTEYMKAWRKRNPDYMRQWREANAERVAEYNRNRRRRPKNA